MHHWCLHSNRTLCCIVVCRERAVTFVIDRGLNNVCVGTAAGVALLDLCHACSGRLVDQFDSLTTQCLLALKRPQRDAEVAINVLKGHRRRYSSTIC